MPMKAPNLKRVTVSSEDALHTWLAQNAQKGHATLLVTHVDPSHPKYVSRAQMQAALSTHGWTAGQRYTLTRHLLGHVVSPATVTA